MPTKNKIIVRREQELCAKIVAAAKELNKFTFAELFEKMLVTHASLNQKRQQERYRLNVKDLLDRIATRPKSPILRIPGTPTRYQWNS